MVKTSYPHEVQVAFYICYSLFFLYLFTEMDLDTEETSSISSAHQPSEQSSECISKNALKKKRKWEKIQETNKNRRRDQKQNKKSKNDCDNQSIHTDSPHLSKRLRIQMERQRLLDVLNYSSDNCDKDLESPLQICIDLQFGDKMSDKEISHLAGQVRRVYGANKSSERPVKLSLVSLEENKRTYNILCKKNDGFENYILFRTEKSLTDHFSSIKEKLVYLTPDSPNPLQDLETDKVYVIGGLVDDSVQKDTTKSYASNSNITTARLPIQEHCLKNFKGNYSFKQILTINQVFEILLAFHHGKDWSSALGNAIPQKVGFVGK